jgi:hypothetical protein
LLGKVDDCAANINKAFAKLFNFGNSNEEFIVVSKLVAKGVGGDCDYILRGNRAPALRAVDFI